MLRYRKDDQTRNTNPIIIKIVERNKAATNIIKRVIIVFIYSFPGFKAVDIIVLRLPKVIYLRSKSLPRKSPITKAIIRLIRGFSLI